MAVRRTPAKRLPPEALWDWALKALNGRAYTTAELRRKLGVRAENRAAVQQVMDKLQEYGLLNDQRFAESFATSRLENKGFGAARVFRDLRSRSVSGALAESAIRQVYAEVEEDELAQQFLARKFRGKDLPVWLKEEKNLAAAYRRLRTAGFTSAASIRALKRHASRADELDAIDEEEPRE
jgi:regulatory protein